MQQHLQNYRGANGHLDVEPFLSKYKQTARDLLV